MNVAKQLGVDTLLSDVQRMDKRQVRLGFQLALLSNCINLIEINLNFIPSLQFLFQVLSFGMIVASALMIWKGLMFTTNSESPIVVVLTGSMEPAFFRGDLLFLTNPQDEPVRVGDIVVFKIRGRDIPIVHRVIKIHEK